MHDRSIYLDSKTTTIVILDIYNEKSSLKVVQIINNICAYTKYVHPKE
jgi:hypothetical protein